MTQAHAQEDGLPPSQKAERKQAVRILQVVTNMNMGGIETLLMSLYRRMDRSKIQFDFLMHRSQESHFDQEILRLGGRIYRVPPFNPFHHLSYLKALDAFFREHPEYKVVHTHNNALGMYVLRAARKAGVPACVAHSHTSSVPFDWKRTAFYNYCRMRINRYIDYPLACSGIAGTWLYGKRLTASGRLGIVRNGIEVDRFAFSQSVRQEMRKQLNIHNQLVFGHVGRFKASKNHAFLLEIFREILHSEPDAILLLVGDGKLEEAIKHQAQEMHIDEQVRFLGVCSDIAQLLQAMDVFLFPSLYEGLGIVLVEAQSAGLPCLASDMVPREAKVIDSLEWMSLELPSATWADAAIRMAKAEVNRDKSQEVKASGYDITKTASWLQDFYIARHREAEGRLE